MRWATVIFALLVGVVVSCKSTRRETSGDAQSVQVEQSQAETGVSEQEKTTCTYLPTREEARDRIDSPPLPPTSGKGDFFLWFDWEAAIEVRRGELEEEGGSPRDWVTLGQCQTALGQYEAALEAFDEALKASPNDATAQTEKQRATDLLRVAQGIQPELPDGQEVIQVDELNVEKGRPLWVVLSGNHSVMDHLGFPWRHDFSDVCLNLYHETGQGLERVWRSDELRGHGAAGPRAAGGPRGGPSNDVHFYVLDLTGDGTPEVVVGQLVIGVSWAPSHLEVFAWRGNQLTNIVGVDSDHPAWVRDLNDDGRYEIGNDYAIGWSMCHTEQPRWGDIYAYKNKRYVLANEEFPEKFKDWSDEFRQVLEEYPGDWEILKYLGIAHEIEGRPDEALAAYRRAEKACRAEIEEPGRDAQSRAGLRGELKDIQARIRKLR